MIEGIVLIFVILFAFLFIPPAIRLTKRWWEIYTEDDLAPAGSSFYVDGQTGKSTSVIASDNAPMSPCIGMRWMNTKDGKIYTFTGEVWKLDIIPKTGDLWLW